MTPKHYLRRRRGSQAGFSLTELMVVVSIIGMLFSLALWDYQSYVVRAKIAEGLELAAPVQEVVAAYYDYWGHLPGDHATEVQLVAQAQRGRYVDHLEVKHGVITITFKDLSAELASASLTLRPAVHIANSGGALVWSCGNAAAPAGYVLVGAISGNALASRFLPGACRA